MATTTDKINIAETLERVYRETCRPLMDTLRGLQDTGISFVIINLPLRFDSTTRPNDLDLLLDPQEYNEAIEFLKTQGYVRLDLCPGPGQIALVKYFDEKGYVRLHLHADLNFFGTCFIKFKQAVKRTVACDGFLVADAILDWHVLHIEWLFRKKAHYAERIAQVARYLDKTKAADETSTLCGSQAPLVRRIINMVSHRVTVSTSLQLNLMLSHRPLSPAVHHHILSKLFSKLRWPRLRCRRGLLVFFMGIDGTGKSTIAEMACARTDQGGFCSRYEYLGLKDTFVQKVRRKLIKQNDRERFDGQSGVADHLARKSPIVAQIFNLCLAAAYLIEYRLWATRLMRFVSNDNNVMFVDRAYYDKLTELHKWGNKLFFNLLPKPDLVIALHGDPELLYARKPEFEVPVLVNMQDGMNAAWTFLETHNIPVLKVDTTSNDIKTCSEIVTQGVWMESIEKARG